MQNSISEQARAAALAQLDAAETAREDILVQHIANGVCINSRTVQIDPEVVIAPGAVILAGTILRGKTVIGAGEMTVHVWSRVRLWYYKYTL